MKGWIGCVVFGLMVIAGDRLLAQANVEYCQESPEKIYRTVKAGKGVLLDVREPVEWQAGHLRQARLLSAGNLKKMPAEELARLLARDVPVYIHCEVGGRSMDIAKYLRSQGYNVKPLRQNCRDLAKGGFDLIVPSKGH
jgi:rhodanese-related sulfurtransferase